VTAQRQNDTFTAATIRLRIENTTAETIPPYSIVAIGQAANLTPGILTRDGDGVGKGAFTIKVRKPDATSVGSGSPSQFLISLDLPIPAGKTGFATPSLPAFVAVESGITDRATRVGPVAGQWTLGAVEGFYHVVDILTVAASKYALVQGAAGGGGGGGSLFRFELTANFSTGNTVAATIKTMGGSTVGTGISLTDPELIFFGLLTGSKGYCLLQSGVYYPIQAACNDEEGYL
jgi:hypothetical protein